MTTRIVTTDPTGAVVVDITIHTPDPPLPLPRPIVDTTGREVREALATRRVA